MKKNNVIRFVQSLVLLPVMAGTLPFGSVPNDHKAETSHIVFAQKQNIEAFKLLAFNPAGIEKAETLKAQAEAIDAYFKARNMPLEGVGMKMVEEADKNGLDWRLLPAIAIRESTGGKQACKKATYNSFGWGSCKISFDSNEEAIEKIASHLGGNHFNTDQYYADKTTEEILRKYNSVIPKYVTQVVSIMDAIGDEDITAPVKA